MKNKIVSTVIEMNGQLYIAIPDNLKEHLSISDGDLLGFSCSSPVRVWKDSGIDVPEEIFSLLMKTFKTESQVFKWLNTKREYLNGNTAISLISSEEGKAEILDLIHRINTGDFS